MENEEKSGVTMKESVYDWLEAAVFALVLITFVFSFCFRMVGVDGASMNDTLQEGNRLLLLTNRYTPAFGDIIVIARKNSEEPLIKRVIGVEGDTIRVEEEECVVYVNGKKLIEPYVDELYKARNWRGQEEIVVQPGTVFVLGDHRDESLDSRDPKVGLIDVNRIMGKAIFRVFPFAEFGSIYQSEALYE